MTKQVIRILCLLCIITFKIKYKRGKPYIQIWILGIRPVLGTGLNMGTHTEIKFLGRIVFLKKEASAIRKIIEFDHYKRVWIASAEAYGTNPKVGQLFPLSS